MLTLRTPMRLYIDDSLVDALRPKLTFKDERAVQALKRFRTAYWFANQHGEEAFQERLQELEAAVHVTLLFEDENGTYTHSGLSDKVSGWTRHRVQNLVVYPDDGLSYYASTPKKLRAYQIGAVETLRRGRHAAIELATGTGKTAVLEELVHRHGLQSVVVTPSVSIARQMFPEFQTLFGKKNVGLYGDGRHDLGKRITIGIAASLTRVDPKSEAGIFFRRTQVLLIDEAHLVPSETQSRLCLGIFAAAPYRYFVSGTQFRNDGTDLLLEALTGPIVYTYCLQEAVDQGFLAKPNFRTIQVPTDTDYQSPDTLEMMNAHVYKNRILHGRAADLANKAADAGRQVLILIEHVEQFQFLLPFMRHAIGFAHGGVNASNKKFVDPRFHKSDSRTLVTDFNANRFRILIGTSCVSIGTDFQGVDTIIYLQGGKSEIKLQQAIGRGTRKPPGKEQFWFVDFDVEAPSPPLRRHAELRRGVYRGLYPNSFQNVG